MRTSTGLAVRHLTHHRGGVRVLDDVSLDVQPGQIHALVGLNGAGKTTLMRTLLGMLAPDCGVIDLFGGPVADAGPEIWARVGHLLEQPFAYPELTVTENVYSSARLHGLSRRTARQVARRAVADFGLADQGQRRSRELAQGNRQRTGLAASLCHAPTLVVLDEPTNALDPRGVITLREMLRQACRDRGAAVLVSSHHLDEVSRLADRISVLHGGRIVGALPPGTVDLERRFFDVVLQADEAGSGGHGTAGGT